MTQEGSVRVVLRIRPLQIASSDSSSQLEEEEVVSKVMSMENAETEVARVFQNPKLSKDPKFFEFDAVFDEQDSPSDIYTKSGAYDGLKELFRGYHCTIFAYGQSGSGKTYTMGTSGNSTGIIPRACADLFDLKDAKAKNVQVHLNYLEVYNDEIRDLLAPTTKTCTAAAVTNSSSPLQIREDKTGQVFVEGLATVPVESPEEIEKLMEFASTRRVVASTKLNTVSSRSHAICIITITGESLEKEGAIFQSKLTLVDLAGSERYDMDPNSKESRKKEGISINIGLFVLGQVISNLASTKKSIMPPFRNSKLTRLLQNSLGGNSRTIMIACCNPSQKYVEETLNTLRYATQARNIKNSLTQNIYLDPHQEQILKLQKENLQLKQQNMELREQLEQFLQEQGEGDDIEESPSVEELQRLLVAMQNHLQEQSDNMSAMQLQSREQILTNHPMMFSQQETQVDCEDEVKEEAVVDNLENTATILFPLNDNDDNCDEEKKEDSPSVSHAQKAEFNELHGQVQIAHDQETPSKAQPFQAEEEQEEEETNKDWRTTLNEARDNLSNKILLQNVSASNFVSYPLVEDTLAMIGRVSPGSSPSKRSEQRHHFAGHGNYWQHSTTLQTQDAKEDQQQPSSKNKLSKRAQFIAKMKLLSSLLNCGSYNMHQDQVG